MVEQDLHYGDHDVTVRKVGLCYSIRVDGGSPFHVECAVADLERHIRECIATHEAIAEVRRGLDNGIY